MVGSSCHSSQYNMEDGMSAAAGQKRPPPMHRPAAFEDRAKPVWVSLPFVAVAAVAVILLGHFVSYRKGALWSLACKRWRLQETLK